MAVKFSFYGGMTILTEREDGFKILFDPYISENESASVPVSKFYDVDVIIITHAAFDHFGDTVEILKNGHAMVIGGAETRRKILADYPEFGENRWHGTTYGDCYTVGGSSVVHTVFAQHGSNVNTEGVWTCWPPYGYVVQIEPGVTFYHTGDTYLYSDMKMLRELYQPTVMTMPIAGITPKYPCMMTPVEAARSACWVGAVAVIPAHYPPQSPTLNEFKQAMKFFAPNAYILDGPNRSFYFHPCNVEEVL